MSRKQDIGAQSSDDEKHLTKRRMLQSLSAAGVAGLAGCGSASESTPTEGDDGDDTPTDEDTATPQGPPLRENLRVRVTDLPQELNFNPWSNATTFGGVYKWLRDLDLVRDLGDNRLHSGHTWDIDYRKGDSRELSVPTLVNDSEIVEVEENYTLIVYDINEEAGFTYWDGTPITASAWEQHLKMGYYMGGDHMDDEEYFSWGREEEPGKLYYYWGGAPGEEAESNPSGNPEFNILQWHSAPPPESPPIHPDFTGKWIDRMKDADDEEELDEIVSELTNTSLGLETMVENQWGQGPYKIESTDDFSEESIQMTLRDDHPRSEEISVPQLEIKPARGDRYKQLLRQGEIDYAPGLVQEDSPPLDGNVLPDHFQQIDSWSAGGTTMLYFNWLNDHIARQGVRRAIVAAVPWEQVRVNGWGEGGTLPMEHDSGLDTPNNKQWLSDDFLDQLYQYPRDSDTELAAQFLREEGYEKDGDIWRYEDGEPLELVFLSNNDISPWLGAAQTIQNALQAFGFRIQLDNVNGTAYQDRAENHQFDFMINGHPASNPWSYFGTHDGAMVTKLYAGEDDGDFFRCNPDQETDDEGKPTTVTVPNEVGALEIEGDGETYNMCGNSQKFYQYDTTPDELEEIMKLGARWYNYDLPHYHFMNLKAGFAGNVRDFDWPAEGQTVNTAAAISDGHYKINTGAVRTTHDDSY